MAIKDQPVVILSYVGFDRLWLSRHYHPILKARDHVKAYLGECVETNSVYGTVSAVLKHHPALVFMHTTPDFGIPADLYGSPIACALEKCIQGKQEDLLHATVYASRILSERDVPFLFFSVYHSPLITFTEEFADGVDALAARLGSCEHIRMAEYGFEEAFCKEAIRRALAGEPLGQRNP